MALLTSLPFGVAAVAIIVNARHSKATGALSAVLRSPWHASIIDKQRQAGQSVPAPYLGSCGEPRTLHGICYCPTFEVYTEVGSFLIRRRAAVARGRPADTGGAGAHCDGCPGPPSPIGSVRRPAVGGGGLGARPGVRPALNLATHPCAT